MDCIRAVDFLSSRPEVDKERIAVWGGSQGGGLSFMTASLDERISYCLADVPWLCDWVRYFKTSHWEEIDDWLAEDSKRSWDTMLRELSYFDTMNMAERIKCPVLMGVGLQDKVCPPSTSFATYNRIKSPKEYRVYIRSGHSLNPKHWDLGYKWVRGHFGLE
jgi:cephalosporin-C deacetylase-like acetyl esterase